MYRVGIKHAAKPHAPIIVVGNLTVGGFGKSPTIIYLAKLLQSMNREVVIGCSGYGGPHAEAAALAPDGSLDAREWGDEPAMIREALPKVPLVVGRRRVLAAELVHQAHPNAVLLMDDGFQHLPLAKDISIVIDAAQPINGACLPAGPYREPRSNRRRADAMLWVGKHDGFELVRGPTQIPTPAVKVTSICALGQPDQFLAGIRRSKELVEPLVLADHDPLQDTDLFSRVPSGIPVVVTEKDWVKLRTRDDLTGKTIVVAHQEISIEPFEAFRDWLRRKLDER